MEVNEGAKLDKARKDILQQKHFEETFREYLGGVEDLLPRDAQGKVRILSVGCGSFGGAEAVPLVRSIPQSDYKGIDLSDADLKDAEFFSGMLDPNHESEIQFKVEDAKVVDDSERGKYGLVVMRNPAFPSDTPTYRIKIGKDPHPEWEGIVKASIDKIAPGGFMLGTTGDSIDEVRKYFKLHGLRIVRDERNKISTERDLFKDHWIILGRKEK